MLLVAFALAGCEAEERCDQAAVDRCYRNVGCEDRGVCHLELDGVNGLCACLTDRGCDQLWFHDLCDGSPFDAGTCSFCGQ
jgi:hypothetical protein